MENKLTYTKIGDYYIPNLTTKPSPPFDKYGKVCRDYLRNHRPALYNLLDGGHKFITVLCKK